MVDSKAFKKVVIVGGGWAGARLAYELERSKVPLDVILVDTKEYFENNLGALRALVRGRKFGKHIVWPHSSYLKKTRIVVALGTSTSDNAVTLDNGDTLPFDFLALCTGSSYALMKGCADTRTVEQRLAQYDAEAARIKASTGVIVVGGGAGGVELVGEIAEVHPDKPVTLVTSSDRLLPSMRPSSSTKMAEIVASITPQVKVILNDRLASEKNADGQYMTEKGVALEGDCVLMATGIKPANEIVDSTWLDSKGHIKVNADLRIFGKENIFCAGDVNDVKEEKLAYRAEYHAKVIAQNIAALATNPQAKTKEYSAGRPIAILNYGSTTGLAEFPFIGTITRVIPTFKAKTLFVDKIRGSFGLPLASESS